MALELKGRKAGTRGGIYYSISLFSDECARNGMVTVLSFCLIPLSKRSEKDNKVINKWRKWSTNVEKK